ncbi:hypothetical protein ASF83_17465 [Plantibacter sp. Leaf171]|uniref:hypothetical protein n=1 Tax=unclassified Plantibacter TaxID=2624265 RepID=UPI0006F1E96E|nr:MULTISPECIES: hypothetical protein [unclassified Plantibacter]KQM13525.1 hypothetical protein ASE44_17480 [Plantibacter sp. Leaf1]KQR56633.1 hypothetical protein ASF83_17465 [Plantibacter sp. Leaf171]
MKRSTLPALAVVLLALAGCSAGTPTQTSAPSATTAAPTATPSATSEPMSDATCETVLTDEEYASLAEDGLVLDPDIFVLDDTMQSIIDAGGLGCYWARSGGDIRVWYAQGAKTSAEWDTQKQSLIGAGWTETDASVAGALQAPDVNDPDYLPVVTYRDGVVYYASVANLLPSVKALQE